MRRVFDDLTDRHPDALTYVIGSGPSLNHLTADSILVGPDDVIIAVNEGGVAALGIVPDYIVTQHPETVAAMLDRWPLSIIVAMDHWPHGPYPLEPDPRLITWTPEPTKFDWERWNPHTRFTPSTLFWGTTSAPAALQLACVMGSQLVLGVGLDCAIIDGAQNVNGYPGTIHNLTLWNDGLTDTVAVLREHYRTPIHSLNPFINLHAERHTVTT